MLFYREPKARTQAMCAILNLVDKLRQKVNR
jgi:hypothetical protein